MQVKPIFTTWTVSRMLSHNLWLINCDSWVINNPFIIRDRKWNLVRSEISILSVGFGSRFRICSRTIRFKSVDTWYRLYLFDFFVRKQSFKWPFYPWYNLKWPWYSHRWKRIHLNDMKKREKAHKSQISYYVPD